MIWIIHICTETCICAYVPTWEHPQACYQDVHPSSLWIKLCATSRAPLKAATVLRDVQRRNRLMLSVVQTPASNSTVIYVWNIYEHIWMYDCRLYHNITIWIYTILANPRNTFLPYLMLLAGDEILTIHFGSPGPHDFCAKLQGIHQPPQVLTQFFTRLSQHLLPWAITGWDDPTVDLVDLSQGGFNGNYVWNELMTFNVVIHWIFIVEW